MIFNESSKICPSPSCQNLDAPLPCYKGKDVGMAINKYGDKGIKWVSHGMLRIEVSVMKKLFEHPINKMIEVGLLFYIH